MISRIYNRLNLNTVPRVFPMVSSMISVQWRDGSFWKSADTLSNDYTIQTVPEFSDDFEYYHFHGHYQINIEMSTN